MIKIDCLNYFDISEYPLDNIYGIPQVNKITPGVMKDENDDVAMTDFVILRLKLNCTNCTCCHFTFIYIYIK